MSGRSQNGLRSRVTLLAILLLAFALRVHRLDAQSLWYDEAVTAQVARQGIPELTRWTADDIQPPLYYYMVAGWTRLAGTGEWALRFVSTFFGVLLVVLVWSLARRLFGDGPAGPAAPLLAALLAALSPLYVYYAQEARMYAMLTSLGALAGYALLRASGTAAAQPSRPGAPEAHPGSGGNALDAARGNRAWWLLFILAAVASLYTHYFAAFLLLAYALCLVSGWLIDRYIRRSPRRRLETLGPAVLSGIAVFVLYLPWLPAMLARYRLDRSYWQGSLKLGEAIRHLAINFTTGAPETNLESAAVRLLPWFALALGLAVGSLLIRGLPRRVPAILLVVLIVPSVLVLALAMRTPKFNPRYLMLVSPAYLLLLSGGIVSLAGLGRRRALAQERRSGIPGAVPVVVAMGMVAFLVITSALGLHNWFTDPAFVKAQWREVVAAVRDQIGPGETVMLVSGHAAPAWDYYAPDIPRTRVPDIDILDVDATLGFDVGPTLGRALAGKSGTWVVLWQAETVDPGGFVPYFLDRAGTEIPSGQQFWHVKLRHWLLRPDASYPVEPQPDHADGANFAHQIALTGWDDPQSGEITVYWRALAPTGRDLQVSLLVEDASGHEVGTRWDGRPAGYGYPTFRWLAGRSIFGTYPLPRDLSPGDYYVTLALYDGQSPDGLDIMDVADNPAGKRIRLGPVRLAVAP